jgi:hypothetical protein
VCLIFLTRIVLNKNYNLELGKGYLGVLLIYILVSIPSIGYFGEYFSNIQKYDKLVVYNTRTGDLPHFYKKTNFNRPGVQSVLEGYFTFRIFDLIEHPITSNEDNVFPLHRTSVWSQLYGRANFIYFDDWPISVWQSRDERIMNVGRAAFVLGLLPVLVFLIGLFAEIKRYLKRLLHREIDFLKLEMDWIYLVFLIGYVSFIILFTALGRDFSFMKIIYIFPGILVFCIPFVKGSEILFEFFKNNLVFKFVYVALTVLLFVAYIIPVVNLIIRMI